MPREWGQSGLSAALTTFTAPSGLPGVCQTQDVFTRGSRGRPPIIEFACCLISAGVPSAAESCNKLFSGMDAKPSLAPGLTEQLLFGTRERETGTTAV